MKTNNTNSNSRAMATAESSGVSESERSERERAMGLSAVARARQSPEPEVVAQASRRRFSAQYKMKILQQLDQCTNSGDVGALLRREGLYSSHLTKWRRQREQGALEKLQPQKRGRPEAEVNPLAKEVARLQKENDRLQTRLKQAEIIIDVQKKVSQLLGISLPQTGESN